MSRVNTQSKYDNFKYRARISAFCQETLLNDQKLDLTTLIKSRIPFDEKAAPMPNGMSVDDVVSLMSTHVELQILNAVSNQAAIRMAIETQQLHSVLRGRFTQEVFAKYIAQIFAFMQLKLLLSDAINEAYSTLILDISNYVRVNFSFFEKQADLVSEETDDEASSDDDEYDSSFSPR